MKRGPLKFAAFATCAALCAPALGINPEGGRNGGRLPGTFEPPGIVTVTADFTFGELTSGRVIQTQTMIGRHTATEYQRRIAEQNAKVFFKQLTPEKKGELKQKRVRTVLIRTVRSRQTSPKAKTVLMRFSLEGESLIDPVAYEFETPPPVGSVGKFTGVDAEYVGL
jgi:hypothetical protein